jgi:hypothetical protein
MKESLKKYLIKNFTISSYMGGLGNNLQQIALGCMYANLFNFNFYNKSHQLVNDFSIINNKFYEKLKKYRHDSRFYYFDVTSDSFLHSDKYELDYPLKSEDSEYYRDNFYYIFQNYIEPNLKNRKFYDFDSDTIVIHIRSGDIFAKNEVNSASPTYYLQNPLVYYENLISQYKKTVLVSSKTHNNPVIKIIDNLYDVEIISSDVNNDFNVLLGAKNLATSGVGTFAVAAALASKKLKNFHHSNLFYNHHLNPWMVKNVSRHEYRFENYLNVGSKWIGSEEQIELMLSEKIKISEI